MSFRAGDERCGSVLTIWMRVCKVDPYLLSRCHDFDNTEGC